MSAVLTHEIEPHGEVVVSMQEQSRREQRAAEILQERLGELDRIADLIGYMDASAFTERMPIILQKLDRACDGNKAATDEILRELSRMQEKVERCAKVMWGDEVEQLAIMEAV